MIVRVYCGFVPFKDESNWFLNAIEISNHSRERALIKPGLVIAHDTSFTAHRRTVIAMDGQWIWLRTAFVSNAVGKWRRIPGVTIRRYPTRRKWPLYHVPFRATLEDVIRLLDGASVDYETVELTEIEAARIAAGDAWDFASHPITCHWRVNGKGGLKRG